MAKPPKPPPGQHKVGYGKPPKAHQFKKGQSGNPSGRPKAVPTLQQDLLKELTKVVSVSVRGKPVKITKQQALVGRVMNLAINGDINALRLVMNHVAAAQAGTGAEPVAQAPLTEEELAAFNLLSKKITGHEA